MTMITPSYLGETIEYSSLHACRSTLEDPTQVKCEAFRHEYNTQRPHSSIGNKTPTEFMKSIGASSRPMAS